MPHIALPEGIPGIAAGFAYRPETSKPMRELAHILLHEPGTLTPGERELIATYVSSRNRTHFCASSHGAAAASHLGGFEAVEAIKADVETAPVSAKLKTLLHIAGKVQQDGKLVTPADIEAARKEGATDLEIHDTVLIAAAFSMYNRYVDGLGTWQPEEQSMYTQMGKRLAEVGYRNPGLEAGALKERETANV
ncbi:carboxymuconolactone decarboxylase family protein [Silvibacterium sp.]|uniref:carboxymuconolactone decarboxylase family protein n=1 Tax=Silvibacterium sp. TaxID=1964179 RepID=UPI0039E3C746